MYEHLSNIEKIESIFVSCTWANNHKKEFEYIVKNYGPFPIKNKEDELLYFWLSSEGIQLCMWFSTLFVTIENLENMLQVDVKECFPLLKQIVIDNEIGNTLYDVLKKFRNYCFHIDSNHVSDKFINFIFDSYQDTLINVLTVHTQISEYINTLRGEY